MPVEINLWETFRSITALAWQARIAAVALPFQLGAQLIRGVAGLKRDK